MAMINMGKVPIKAAEERIKEPRLGQGSIQYWKKSSDLFSYEFFIHLNTGNSLSGATNHQPVYCPEEFGGFSWTQTKQLPFADAAKQKWLHAALTRAISFTTAHKKPFWRSWNNVSEDPHPLTPKLSLQVAVRRPVQTRSWLSGTVWSNIIITGSYLLLVC